MGERRLSPEKLIEELRAQLAEPDIDERHVLTWAVEFKELLVDAYRDAAEAAEDELLRRLYLRVAKEEQQRIDDLRAELQAMTWALTDSLTGLENRRSFDRRLKTEIGRVRRYGQTLACVFIDVDNFKAVNDRWGHVAGDEVLRQMAALLVSAVRAGDVAARYGGDEFALLLPHATEQSARRAAERLTDAVHQHAFTWEDEVIPLRVSVGVACMGKDDPLEDLVRRADEDLVRAKRAAAGYPPTENR